MNLVTSILDSARLDHGFKEAVPATLPTVIQLHLRYFFRALFLSASYSPNTYNSISWNPVKIFKGMTVTVLNSTSELLKDTTYESYSVVKELTSSFFEMTKRVALLRSPFYTPRSLVNLSLIRLIGILAIATLATFAYALMNRKLLLNTSPYEREKRNLEEFGKKLDSKNERKIYEYQEMDFPFLKAIAEIERLSEADPKTFRLNPDIEFLDLSPLIDTIEGYVEDTEETFTEAALFSFDGGEFFVVDEGIRHRTVELLEKAKNKATKNSLTEHEVLALRYTKAIALYIVRKNSVYSKVSDDLEDKTSYINLVIYIAQKLIDGSNDGCVDQNLSQLEEIVLTLSLFHQGNLAEGETTPSQFGLLLNQYRLSLIKELIQKLYPDEEHAVDMERAIKRMVLQDLNIPIPLLIKAGAQFTNLWGRDSADLQQKQAAYIREHFLKTYAAIQWLIDQTSHAHGRTPNIVLGKWLTETYEFDWTNKEHIQLFGQDPYEEVFSFNYNQGTTLFFLLRSGILIPRAEDIDYHEERAQNTWTQNQAYYGGALDFQEGQNWKIEIY